MVKRRKNKKIIFLLLFLAILNWLFAFSLIFKDVKISLNILKPSFLIYVNKDNYFQSSDYSTIISNLNFNLNEPQEITVDSNNSLIVLPLYYEKASSFDIKKYNLSIDFYLENIENASQYLEIYYAKIYSSSCYGDSWKIGKINTSDGLKVICAVKKLNETDFESDYIGNLNFEIENTEELKDSKLLVFNVNPLYVGKLNIKMIAQLIPN
jgi:hypothetical protein